MELKKEGFFRSFFGTKAFYIGVITLLIPMIVQQGLTNFVNLLDNVMIGQLGTEAMSGVAIVNQLIFIFNLTIFGGVSGASIFGAQFYGKGDIEGVRHTFRFKLWLSLIVCVVGIGLFLIFGNQLVSLFLNEAEGDSGDLAYTLECAMTYLRIMLIGLVPFAVVQCFGSTLKDTGETFEPMVASIIALAMNLVLNYLLIYGKFGFPKWGVAGAAVATVISRYAEMIYIIIATFRKKKKFTFINGAFKTLKVPFQLVKRITFTAMPLLVNEMLWALGMAMISQFYSTRGLSAVAATNINSTISNVFSIVMFALGNAVGIIVGQQLGANDIKGAKSTVKKLLMFSVLLNVVVCIIVVATAPVIPHIYNTTDYVRETATTLLIITGLSLPFDAYLNSAYFTIRSGGKTLITFLFDCVFEWVIVIPIIFVLANFTTLSLPIMYLAFKATAFIKIVIGTIMLKSGIWAKNVVNTSSEPASENT